MLTCMGDKQGDPMKAEKLSRSGISAFDLVINCFMITSLFRQEGICADAHHLRRIHIHGLASVLIGALHPSDGKVAANGSCEIDE